LSNDFAYSDFAYAVSAESEVNTIGFTLEFVEDKIEGNKLSDSSERELLDCLTGMIEEIKGRLKQLIKPCGTDNRPQIYGVQNALTRITSIHKFANRIVNH